MKRRVLFVFGWAMLFGVALAWAEDKSVDKGKSAGKSLAAARCPVSGEKVSEDASVAYKGGKVYFCCKGCIESFTKDQAKFATKANCQLVQTGQAKQKGCPLTGGKINAATKTNVCGADVSFCCNGCKGKVAKLEAAKQCEMCFGDKAFEKGFQTAKD